MLFLLIVIVTQVAFLIVARDATGAAVSAAARRAARPGVDLSAERARLAEDLGRVVAGAEDIVASVDSDGALVTVRAGLRWLPPGPDLVPIVIRASSTAPVVVPP